ncbi:MAG: class I SAM-dependent methyltransferase [Candidatus Dormibacteraeota bacterium]|nr:class I SAM-dependent methyltransferase [Candidatus Dormibacteraeota bacterium]
MTVPYSRSARVYDLLYTSGVKDFAADVDAVHNLIAERNSGARTLLDVACGTGIHMAALREWYEVSGVDASPDMLAVARGRLGDAAQLTRGDLVSFDLGRTFGAVTCLFSSIGYLTNDTELRRAFSRMAAPLVPGGVLVVDGWIRPDAWADGFREPPREADDGTTTVVRVTRSTRSGRITTLEMHHLVRTGDGVDYFVEIHEMMLTPTADYVAMAEAAGLNVDVVPDFMPGRDRIVGVKPG